MDKHDPNVVAASDEHEPVRYRALREAKASWYVALCIGDTETAIAEDFPSKRAAKEYIADLLARS